MAAAEAETGGLLCLVVGPSGAGKDTLMERARAELAPRGRHLFVRRVITRQADAGGEDHEPETVAGFQARAAAGDFLLHWQAHGLCYGIPATVAAARRDGMTVVANVSRAVLDDARRRAWCGASPLQSARPPSRVQGCFTKAAASPRRAFVPDVTLRDIQRQSVHEN